MAIKNIIFDFGGVLIDWNPEYLFRKVFDDENEMRFFLREVCSNDWNLKQDEGRTFEEAIRLLSEEHPQYKDEIAQYFSRWLETVGGDIAENSSLIEALKPNYRLFGLTNWSAETFPLAYRKYPFFKALDGIVVSGEEKLIKPDHRIYQRLLERYDLILGESVFIDDSKPNIDAALELGFKVVHYSEQVNLKEELVKLGIQIDQTILS